jgi:hypothetical protein
MDIAWRSCTRMLSGKLKIFSFAKEVISIYQFISVCIQLSASKPVYSFASLVEDSRENHTDLIIPDGFPKEIFAKYQHESIDFRDIGADGVLDNSDDGMPFTVISSLLIANTDNLAKAFPDKRQLEFIVKLVKLVERIQSAADEQDMTSDSYFWKLFVVFSRGCQRHLKKDK